VSAAPGAGYPRLVADVGGTHARLAWIRERGQPLTDVARLSCDAFASLAALLAGYRADARVPAPRSAALALAAPVEAGARMFTNRAWTIDPSAISEALGGVAPLLCNDFRALARGVAGLQAHETSRLGSGTPDEQAARAVVGAGTGLGVAGLLHTAGGPVVVAGEGGHAGLAASDEEDEALLRMLARRHGRASAERALSGPGLVALYEAVCARASIVPACRTAEEVVAGDAAGDPACRRTVDRFLGWLGSFAGDIALVLGAYGGVYLAGGVVAGLAARIAGSPFRACFEAKGRCTPLMARIATCIVLDAPRCALLGASGLLDDVADPAALPSA
jgi:glucokinase